MVTRLPPRSPKRKAALPRNLRYRRGLKVTGVPQYAHNTRLQVPENVLVAGLCWLILIHHGQSV